MIAGIMCPGQGAQAAVDLQYLHQCEASQPILDAFHQVMGLLLDDVLLGPAERLYSNAYAQPVVCALAMASFATIRDVMPVPTAFAGYSVGELAAYGCAGALKPASVLQVARLRAKSMDDCQTIPSAMYAVRGLSEETVAELCTDAGVFVAIRNDPQGFVVAGTSERMPAFIGDVTALGASATLLPVSVASHTPLMQGATAAVRSTLQALEFSPPTAPVLSGVSGAPVTDRAKAIAALSDQLTRTLDWASCLTSLREQGCSLLLELAPGQQLARMARSALPEAIVRSVADFKSPSGLRAWLTRVGGA